MSSCSHTPAHGLDLATSRGTAGAMRNPTGEAVALGGEAAAGAIPLKLHRLDAEAAGNRTLLDRLGAVLGFLCAIHCLAVPLFLGALPALGFLADHAFDLTLIGVAAVVAFFSARSGLKSHGDRRVAFGFLGAVVLLALGHLLGEESLVGRIPSIIGGFALFALHLTNLRLSRRACC